MAKESGVVPAPAEDSLEYGPDIPVQPKEGATPPREVHGITWFCIVVSMLGSTFLYALDNTVVADVQADILRTLGGVEKLPWLGTAFVWATMSTIPIWSRLYAALNAKWLYLTACVVFEAGSAVCGAAPTMNAMIVGRAVTGLGASGMYLGCLTYIAVKTSDAERPRYMGYTGLSWGSGFILGPIIGGAFAQSRLTWRWAFYINLLLFVVFGPVFLFLLPHHRPQKDMTVAKALKQADWLGSVLELGGTLTGIMAISFGGVVYPWGSGRTIGLFVTAGVASALFLAQQHFAFLTTKAHRIFPMELFKSKSMVLIWFLIVFPGCALVVPIFYQPLFFRFVHGDSPIDAAIRLLPVVMLFVFFAIAGGAIVSKTGWFYPWYLIGSLLIILGSALMYADIGLDSPAGKSYGYTAVMGIGAGAIGQLSYSIAQFKVDPSLVPEAVGLICMGQYLGITVGLTVSGAIFQNLAFNRVSAVLPAGTSADDVKAAIQGLEDTLASVDAITRREILLAIVSAVNSTYTLAIAAGVVALVSTILLGNERFSMSKATAIAAN
ncbi:major facilitator superfamily domain-containing protein [Phialemonium atrogriseum]|uniref:Major facilitator superfamily domain-containing protein n=1 Tax=Phialemonium atrogriseum TaxID=1093897 RepID=A0AAJ0FJS6_9PEZI|nr:major facilitator superfamily domain-containing protein [Phialemonium atrogriseum]KAK1770262.1 major facilitator superfamily domain-containing protein [Phialemonium atrogriseum]